MLINTYTKRVDEKGFTLIELLVVMGILAILMAIVLIAVNPGRQFSLANNSSRSNAVGQILSAVGQYEAENKGAVPPGITATATVIGDGTGQVNICQYLMPTYIPSLPEDPSINNGQSISNCTGYNTGYSISVDTNNRVTVSAGLAELGKTITVTR